MVSSCSVVSLQRVSHYFTVYQNSDPKISRWPSGMTGERTKIQQQNVWAHIPRSYKIQQEREFTVLPTGKYASWITYKHFTYPIHKVQGCHQFIYLTDAGDATWCFDMMVTQTSSTMRFKPRKEYDTVFLSIGAGISVKQGSEVSLLTLGSAPPT